MKSFEISNGIVETNVLSPNGRFYYRLSEPFSLNPSVFGCHGAFYETYNHELVYYNSKTSLYELHNKAEITERYYQMLEKKDFDKSVKPYHLQFVWWSMQGNIAYILEYRLDKHKKPSLVSNFLHLSDRCSYHLDEKCNNFRIIDKLNIKDREYDEEEVLVSLKEEGVVCTPLVRDKLPNRSLLDKLANRNKWYPE